MQLCQQTLPFLVCENAIFPFVPSCVVRSALLKCSCVQSEALHPHGTTITLNIHPHISLDGARPGPALLFLLGALRVQEVTLFFVSRVLLGAVPLRLLQVGCTRG